MHRAYAILWTFACILKQHFVMVQITSVDDMPTEICNIVRISIDEYVQSAVHTSLTEQPFIIVDSERRQDNLISIASRENLIANHGKFPVKLTSSNTYSHGEASMTLEQYVHLEVDIDAGKANETFYLFGNNYHGIFKDLANLYKTPPCKYCEKAGAKTIGIGGMNSGVAFHFHGPGFSEVIIGRKRWLLFPPSVRPVPGFNPNMTVKYWVDNVYPSLSYAQRSQLKDCTIYPGESLYFPDFWMHATLNLDSYNFFVSLFLDIQLMRD